MQSKQKFYIIITSAIIVLAVIILLESRYSGTTTVDEEFITSINSNVEKYLKDSDVPSVAISIAKDGKIIWEDAFGWADKEKKLKATPYISYQIGSVTKNFTATAIMILAERGLLDLDKPANDYLSDAKLRGCWSDPAEATVKRLLLHTAGLQDYWNSYYEHETERKIDTDEAIKRHGVLIYTPGEYYQYSSLGYGVAGRIIESVSGENYKDFMKTEVFEPLGLTKTEVRETSESAENMAQKYDRDGNVCPVWLPNFAASGFIYSTAHDLCRYGIFHLKNHLEDQKQILSDLAIDLMKTAHDSKGRTNTNYKLGWGTDYIFGYEIIRHGGGGPGMDVELILIPSENMAIAVLANSRAGRSFEICQMLVKELLPTFSIKKIWNIISSVFQKLGSIKFDKSGPITGEWRGEIRTYKGNITIRLVLSEDGMAKVQKLSANSESQQWISAANGIRRSKGFIDFWFNGSIIELDPDRPEDYLRLLVQNKGGKLCGSASAGCDILGPERSIFYLPFCVELERVK